MNKIMPKLLAIYLPQFYETKHNNEWWGEGFTDWESVKTLQQYFEGHVAPWKPYHDNYYDLSKSETLADQAKLAKKYGIDGFCFYHYYFANGQMELEKPAENLLKHKEINIEFCFNWASESWIRSWSRIDGNVWSEKYETQSLDSSNGVLVEQDYGKEEDWKKHFNYLLPFFKDDRYIKIDNKPVFIFYRPNDINVLGSMIALWNGEAIKAGFDGLFYIGANTNVAELGLNASLIYEPRTSVNLLNNKSKVIIKNGVRCFDYKDIWREIEQEQPMMGCKTFFSGVVGYDDTPRRGNQGECLINKNEDIYRNGLVKILEKSVAYDNELVFLNAWNEWGEGMYLEPDEKDEYRYLEATKEAKKEVEKRLDSIEEELKATINLDEFMALQKELKKNKAFVQMLDKWLYAERKGAINFCKLFEEQNIKSVAIYGMAMMGKQLYQQLYKEGIVPAYGIDRYVGQYGKDFKIYRPEDNIPDVDAIIITTYDPDNIIRMLNKQMTTKIYKMEELIELFWR